MSLGARVSASAGARGRRPAAERHRGGKVTSKVREAAVGSVFPSASRARTANVCPPCARPSIVCGLVQAANTAPSRRHSNVAGRSLDAKPNVADGTPIVAPPRDPR